MKALFGAGESLQPPGTRQIQVAGEHTPRRAALTPVEAAVKMAPLKPGSFDRVRNIGLPKQFCFQAVLGDQWTVLSPTGCRML